MELTQYLAAKASSKIQFLMTADKAPWSGATVKAETTSLDELKKYIVIAMKESSGWNGSEELKEFMKK